MVTHVFDLPTFQALFPALTNVTVSTGPLFWGAATSSMSDQDNCAIEGDSLQYALNLLTAHIAALAKLLASGQTTVAVMTGASVDKVSVSVSPPPARDAWDYWLQTTPYGLNFLALLEMKSSGGWYFGGAPERQGFRKARGVF